MSPEEYYEKCEKDLKEKHREEMEGLKEKYEKIIEDMKNIGSSEKKKHKGMTIEKETFVEDNEKRYDWETKVDKKESDD